MMNAATDVERDEPMMNAATDVERGETMMNAATDDERDETMSNGFVAVRVEKPDNFLFPDFINASPI